ncbi:MAG: iron-containing alcohol dehydrogenase, partial [Bacteroidales bacterium]|nr:iron-containing alcohol dehydrogenase [Bacteroidales bacterium]
MNNFIFHNPTKLIFGKGTIATLSAEIPADKRILVTFGGGSVKNNGVYNQVKEALKEHTCFEFWGIEPNPSIETLRKAIKLGKESKCDFVLAVGGGSVADGSKLIASGILYEGDPWDIVIKREYSAEKSLPLA